MFRRGIVLLAFAALPCLAAAQPLSERAPPLPRNENPPAEGPIYLIEIVIFEGAVNADEFSDPASEGTSTAPGEVRATFSDPDEWKQNSSPAAPPTPIADALRSEAVAADLDSLPPLDEVSGEIISPAPLPPAGSRVPPEPSLHDRLAGDAHVDILSAPTLAVIEKQEASVYVASRQVFDYLVPLGEGKFEARQTEAYELGIRLNLTVEGGDDAGAVALSPLQIEVTSLDGREPVKGLNLDAGKPIVSARSLKTTVPLRLGEERMLPIPSGPKREAGLILRVKRMESEGKSSKPK